MYIACPVCGNEFRTYPSKIKIGRGKYCGKLCMTDAFKGKRFSPATEFKKGQKPWNTKGYSFTISRKNGRKYKLIHKPDHPNCTKAGYVREHRLVMEEKLGRLIEEDEIVHHLDGNPLNNNVDNLIVMKKVDHDRSNVSLNVHKRWQTRR